MEKDGGAVHGRWMALEALFCYCYCYCIHIFVDSAKDSNGLDYLKPILSDLDRRAASAKKVDSSRALFFLEIGAGAGEATTDGSMHEKRWVISARGFLGLPPGRISFL
ncbi:hypothetical protein SAY86_013232 [Trapa natans]|uniref:Uncharacterized protein n=1 Tax=Trapa natans TaxID=22666 RepID=A0AAN7LTD8_TRANT|nr:hypothetical protein SAY86_013232 [Trapa natans]